MIEDSHSYHGDGWSKQKHRIVAPFAAFLHLFLIFPSLLLKHVLHMTEIYTSMSEKEAQGLDEVQRTFK